MTLSSRIAAIRRGSRRRDASRRSARRKTPGASACRRVDDVGQVDDDAPAPAGGSPGRDAVRAAAGRRPSRGHSRTPVPRRSAARPAPGRYPSRRACTASSSREAHLPGAPDARGRWNRHHHRRRGGQGPRPRHPEPLRGARRRPDATIAVISHRVVAGPRGGRALPGGLRRARRQARSARSTRSPAPQANDETAVRAVRDATGIFLTGGNQLRLSSTIGGTRLADAILDRFRHGAVVAGTSAGASAMSSHMIAFGASRRDAQAPDGPDRGRARRAARASSSTSISSSGTGSAGCSA